MPPPVYAALFSVIVQLVMSGEPPIQDIAPRVRAAHEVLVRDRREGKYGFGFYDLYKAEAVFQDISQLVIVGEPPSTTIPPPSIEDVLSPI